jgi:hypothetical protein
MCHGLTLALVTSCGDSTGLATPVAAYTLVSVNTKTLPATTYADTGYVIEVTAGTITLSADQTYSGSVTTRETVDGNASLYLDHAAGSWAKLDAGTISLRPASGPSQSAVWSGSQLTVTQSDGVFVYARAQ